MKKKIVNNNFDVYWVMLDYDGCFMDWGRGEEVKGNKIGKGLYWKLVEESCFGVLYLDKESYLYNEVRYMDSCKGECDWSKLEMRFVYNEIGIEERVDYWEFLKRKNEYKSWFDNKMKDIESFIRNH